jgi:hypothetical protein
MKKKISCFLILLSCCSLCLAQQVLSSGGYSVKSEVSVNWIIGGSLSDITTIDLNTLKQIAKDQLMDSEISIKVYPLPAVDFINIEITPVDTCRLIIELINNSGVIVINKSVAYQSLLQIDVSDIPSGIYYLKVFPLSSKDQFSKIQKIIKN